jgi:excisionase family DNA binding protein
MPTIVTDVKLAEVLGVSPRTIREWARKGLIPSLRVSSTFRRYDLDDVMEAIKKRGQCHVPAHA